MGKQIKSKARTKVNVEGSYTESVNEVVFADITRVTIDYSEGIRLSAFGSLFYNDGTKDVKNGNINIEKDETELEALLGNQLAILEDILEKVAINDIASKLKLTDADFEKKVKVKKAK